MITTNLTPFPTAPDSSNDTPQEFSTKADAFVSHMANTFKGEVDNVISEINTTQGEINTSEYNSKESENNALASANFKGTWDSATAYIVPSAVEKNGIIYASLLDSTNQDPETATTYWKQIGYSSAVIDAKANTTDVYTRAEIQGAIGNINSPLLDLPLKNSLAMAKGVGSVTFARATTATYIDRYGVLQTASIDEPRFEKEGLLVEGASTNIQTSSNNSELDWNENGLCTIVQGAISPDGTANAWTVSNATTSSNLTGQDNLRLPFTSYLNGDVITSSMWVRSITGAAVNLRSAITTADNQYANTTSTEWVRLSVTVTASIDGNGRIILYSSDGSDFEVAFAQKEELPFASSYIPTTTTAVTRGADDAKVTFENNLLNRAGGYSLAIDAHIPNITTPTVYTRGIMGITNENARYVRVSTLGGLLQGDGLIAGPSPTSKENFRMITVDGLENTRTYIDGVLESSGTSLEIPTPSTREIVIGNQGHSNSNTQLFGHISGIRAWDKELTPQEVSLS